MSQKPGQFKQKITRTLQLNYLLYLPDGYDQDTDRQWPLILFLHGAGERGDDVQMLKVTGLPKTLEETAIPFVVVSPQCPVQESWYDHVDAVDLLLKQIIADYRVDPGRVYLTGLSMGGFGSWRLGTLWPERFAAVVPICGGGHWAYGFPERVCDMKDTPTWVFHGAKDDTVPLQMSQELVDTLKACGGNVKFTIYPEADHDSWTETYNNPEVYDWLLSHKR